MSVYDLDKERTTTTTNAPDIRSYISDDFLDKDSRFASEYKAVLQRRMGTTNEQYKAVNNYDENTFGEYKNVSDNKKKLQAFRWKLLLFNYVFITLCLFAFCIYNVIVISNLNYSIELKRTNDAAQISTTTVVQNDITDELLGL